MRSRPTVPLPRSRSLSAACGLLLLLLLPVTAASQRQEPVGIFLTWQRDPATTMTVDWHTAGEGEHRTLQYRLRGAGEWRTVRVEPSAFPAFGRTLHRTELTRLRPGSTYQLRFGSGGRVYSFRTLPARPDRPIRFATGGDMQHSQALMEEMGREVIRHDPDFVVVGGDLAYADEPPTRANRWRTWFDAYRNTLIAEDGRIVPMLVAQGNHEVAGGYHYNHPRFESNERWREDLSPYFYRLLASPGHPGYAVVDIGDYMSIVLLNSDHTVPIVGEQTRWLERVLAERHGRAIFPVYHVPGYPSVRSFDGPVSVRVREHWAPLFERHGVRVAFENHDHAYKRTFPMRGGQRNADGVIYLGDGCWGVTPREIGRDQQGQRPAYLERAESQRNFILVTIDGGRQRYQAITHQGQVIDDLRLE